MKKFVSIILVITLLFGSISNVYGFDDIFMSQEQYEISKAIYETTETPGFEKVLDENNIVAYSSNSITENNQPRSLIDNGTLTKLNTVIIPQMSNGADKPQHNYNQFVKENISDYSGELTLNFDDLTLKGRNNLDLQIGRTYQTTSSWLGKGSVIRVPHESGQLVDTFVYNEMPYLIERYNLGVGWSFNFPSIQIETEYIPDTIQSMFHYDKESELYYHTGKGDVYRVVYTSDETDSNLEGYYKKDIVFSGNDNSYSNGQSTSFYSLTQANKTKQYFAEDGRLIGIKDRFNNEIKFEYDMHPGINLIPGGEFNCDDDMWATSSTDGLNDAIIFNDIEYGDGYAMRFTNTNDDETYILSHPIQIIPNKTYNFDITLYGDDNPRVKIDFLYYDFYYNLVKTENRIIETFDASNGYEYTCTTSGDSQSRYVMIRISPDYASDLYIDRVALYSQRPLISKITDTIGRTVQFNYEDGVEDCNISISVKTPDGQKERQLIYYKNPVRTENSYMGNSQIAYQWYLSHSKTQGEDGSIVYYEYLGGHDGSRYTCLYIDYDSKQYDSKDGKVQRPLLSGIRYKDRQKVYEYETVRKHLGEYGYYDTLRVKKKYEMCKFADNSDETYFDGEFNSVIYTYNGTYNSGTYDNETGYPEYFFDDKSNLNEKWIVTKLGKNTETTILSNCELVSASQTYGDTSITSEYTHHSIYKGMPIQIKKNVSTPSGQRESYTFYSYNDKGLVQSESREVDADIVSDSSLLEKYTTYYEYNDSYNDLTKRSYYNDINQPQVNETFVYDTSGRMTQYTNESGDTTYYYYESIGYPGIVTKEIQDDPMNFHNVIGGNKETAYTYDTYGLYVLEIAKKYDMDISRETYSYDYLTGDVLRYTLPDGSFYNYTYYSDGRLNSVIKPYTLTLDNRRMYVCEQHNYTNMVALYGYDVITPVASLHSVQNMAFYEDDTNKLYITGAYDEFYDVVGNVKYCKQYNYDGNEMSEISTYYYYDNCDRQIKIVNDIGDDIRYTYDGFDRLLTQIDFENNIYEYAYDDISNSVDISLNNRMYLSQNFDICGNVIKNTVYPDGDGTELDETYQYDLNNNVISYTDPADNTTYYKYDANNNIKETILPDGSKATAMYSSFGAPTTEKIYDVANNEKSARITFTNEKGDARARFYNYDKRLVDADNYLTDVNGRIVYLNEGENVHQYAYDGCDNVIAEQSGQNQIQRKYSWYGETFSGDILNNVSKVYYGYDFIGNLARKQQDNYVINYAYSTLGQRTHATTSWGTSESYTYTPNGNLNTIVSDGNTFDYDYYDTGYVKSISYPGGLKTSYEYDNINRVTKITTIKNESAINTYEYEYDSNGNTTKKIRNGAVTLYSYDSLDRLLSVTYSDGSSVSYEYDSLNNRTKETYSNGDVKDYVYDAKYQLKEIKLNGQVTDTFTYNATGAVVTHNDKVYTYDEWDRMSGYSDGTDTYTYKYDANVIRTQKNDKQYIIDINNNVVAETDSTGAVTDEILWGHQPLARKTNGSWYYYIYNAHGDVVGLVNDAGTVVNTYEYTPWGEIRSETETIDNPIKYAGEYYDDELDMIYLRARYYNPQIGRFTSLDIEEGEIASPLDMNRYVYCRNNPIIYLDPSGQAVETVVDIINIGISLKDLISNPSWANLGFLAWDVGATILPAIPGSYTYKGAKLVKGVSGLGKFTKGNFRKNLTKLIGDAPSWMKKAEAHHVLPQKFSKWFADRGINIHDPRFGSWVDKASHNKWSYEYNKKWEDFRNKNYYASPDEIVNFAKELAKKYGFDVNF